MKKNVAGQVIGAQLVSATDGSAFTGAVTVAVTGDAGTQATGSVGSGACAHEGNGFHTYAPAQAETNYDHVAFTFIGTGAVPATVQLYTTFPQTGDNFARIGATGSGLTSLASQTSVDDLPTNAELATALGTADDAVLTAIGDLPTNAELATALGTADDAVLTAIGDLPTNAELATALGTADDAVLAVVATVDSIVDDIKQMLGHKTTIATLASQTSFTLTAGSANDDAYNGWGAYVVDVSTATQIALGVVLDYTGATKTITLREDPAVFTMAATDHIILLPAKLTDVGAGGLDAAGVRAAVGLASANLDTQLGDLPTNAELATSQAAADDATLAAIATLQTTANDIPTNAELATALAAADDAVLAAIAALNNLSAAGIRTAVGLASANLDTQLADLPTNAELATSQAAADDATLAAIATLQTTADDIPTNAELATALGTADDAVLAAIAALNNLSAAGVRTAVGLATANLDTQLDALPTSAELATALGTADDAVLTALQSVRLSAAGVDDILDEVVEGTITLRQAIRMANAVLGGKASGLAGSTATYRDTGDTKDRIVATVDASGNRTAVVRDLT